MGVSRSRGRRFGELKRTITTRTTAARDGLCFRRQQAVAVGTQRFDLDKEKDLSSGAVSLSHVASGVMESVQIGARLGYAAGILTRWKERRRSERRTMVQFFDTKTGKMMSDIRPDDPSNLERWNDISIAPQANLLAIGGVDAGKRGAARVWDLSGGIASRQ